MALTPPRPEERRRDDPRAPATWKPHLVAGVLMGLTLLQLVRWHWQGSAPGVHLTPRAEHLTNAGLLALPLIPAVALVWMAVRRRLRKGLTLAAVGLILLGALGAGGFLYGTLKLFEPTHRLTVPSPDGERLAHLYVGGLLGCDAVVYVAAPWAMLGQEVERLRIDCNGEVRLEWQPDGGVALHAPPAAPLDFFPH
ncbi:MAG: hypothetical protein AB1938_19635 [Myxococcota bacterium]